jgi:hypothetical protein
VPSSRRVITIKIVPSDERLIPVTRGYDQWYRSLS